MGVWDPVGLLSMCWGFTNQIVPRSSLIQTVSMGDLQEPKLLVPTIYKAYFLGLNFREYPHKIWPEIWYSIFILGSWNSHWELGHNLMQQTTYWFWKNQSDVPFNVPAMKHGNLSNSHLPGCLWIIFRLKASFVQCGAPKIAKLVYSPSNYGYLRTINPSEIVVINQLNAILGAPHCRGISEPCLITGGFFPAMADWEIPIKDGGVWKSKKLWENRGNT